MNFTDQDHRDLVASFPKARAAAALWFGAVASLLVCIAALVSFGSSPRSNEFAVFIAGVGLLGTIVCAITLAVRYQKAQAQAIALVADRFGLQHRVSPRKDERPAIFAPFVSLSMLRSGAKGVKFWLGGEIDDRRVDLIQHTYIVSTGKSAHAVNHLAAATPVPASWPLVTLSPQRSLAGWWATITGADFKLENEAFNARWLVKTDHPDFALLLLTPEVQQFLADAPSAESWRVGNGILALIVHKQARPRDLPQHLLRVIALRHAIPSELDYWGA